MNAFLLALSLLASPRTWAAPANVGDTEPVIQALRAELGRSMSRLKMDKFDAPYYAAYTASDVDRLELTAAFGALEGPKDSRSRTLKVDLRVGSRDFDNSHFVSRSWRVQPMLASMGVDGDLDALRFSAWELTDEAYKAALEELAQKTAYRRARAIKDQVPDLSTDAVAACWAPAAPASLDREKWQGELKRLSAIFRKYPVIQASRLALLWTRQREYLVDSEGRSCAQDENDVELNIRASAQAPDGMELSDVRRVIRQEPGQLPPEEELAKEVRGLAEDLTALSKAPAVEDAYVGPVLFEGQASGEFFNQLFVRNVSFARAPWVEDEGLRRSFPESELAERIGLRALSPQLSAFDDPSAASFGGVPLIGRYEVDDEGVPARRLQLVEKGRLVGLPMGRSPTKKLAGSNGHGRASFGEFPAGRIGNLFIESSSPTAPAELRRQLLERAKDFGLPFGLVVRRLGAEESKDEDARLSAPVLVYRAYVDDGRLELVRGAEFTGVSLRALRDVVAASGSRSVFDYYQLGPRASGGGETQASIVSPDVLVAELELKKSDKKPDHLPYLPRPPLD